MKKIPRMILGCTLAAALALTACSRSDPGSSGSMSTNMGGSSSQTGQAGQNAAYRTGLGILTEASDQERAGKIDTIAAAVLLDAEGRVADVMLDEVEISVTGDSTGKVTMPTDDRTKRQKGDDYPLAAVSSLKKGWAEQADAFGNYLTGKTPDEVKKLATDDDGKPKDADLLSTCTIAVDGYRDAVVRACENAKAVGSARGDRAVLGVSVRNDTKELTADDDHDVGLHVLDDVDGLVDGVGRAEIPMLAETLLRGHRGDVRAKQRGETPDLGDVAVKRVRLVLGEHHDLTVPGVHQVAQREINQTIHTTEGNGGLRAITG